jgi:DNA-binding CsgD family transcriptional regulator
VRADVPLATVLASCEGSAIGHAGATENVLTVLTDRERHIMRLVSEGLSNKEIGRRFNITDGTIKVHFPGSAFATFREAEEACNATLEHLRSLAEMR